MIYTMTINPAVDYILDAVIENGKINRSKHEYFLAGGKGINVSIVLKNLAVDSTALGFVGGFSGNFIKQYLNKANIKHCFTEIEDNSRINIKIGETAINAKGPDLTSNDIKRLFASLDNICKDDILIISGNASSLAKDTYAKMLKIVNPKVLTVVDATGDYLLKCLPFHPFLIKPNLSELEELVGEKIFTNEEIVESLKKLQSLGAKNIIVSMGERGAIMLCDNGQVIMRDAHQGEVKSSVGAGDSMVAGFIMKYLENQDMVESLEFSIKCGSATAFKNGLCTLEDLPCL